VTLNGAGAYRRGFAVFDFSAPAPTGALHGACVPCGGWQSSPKPPKQHEIAHRHPGGQSELVEHVGRHEQVELSWQKQQPSVVGMQLALMPQWVWPAQGPHPQSWQPTRPDAVVALIIDPAPSAAAPMPARLSSRPLLTRSSVTAMQ
jgi:hypothetical protein